MTVQHLDEDQIIVSVVDINDLTVEHRRHLETCPVCREKRGALTGHLDEMARAAREMTPRPGPVQLPEPPGPKVSWGLSFRWPVVASGLASIPLHKHPHPVEELLYILRGRALETVGDEQREIGPGSAVWIPPEVEHKFDNLGDEMLIMLVVVSPPGAVEENLYQTQIKSARQTWDIEYF